MKTSEPPVIVSQRFTQSAAVVWKAITDVTQMRQWFFENIPDFNPEVGFQIAFNVKAPSRDFLHLWTITEVIPHRKVVYNWKYKNLQGDSFVTFKLDSIDNKTKLTLTTTVIKDFPDEVPEFKRESCEAGWQYFINERLVAFVKTV
ncbi:SRPBCC family protein [Kordia jejudonensis]|uniref:SRPBCC family protein n=1 Tax=Kordia jejudonensis TaxID=1348245 RepID=UPI000629005C|nr:SRPBCC domain-containing protein [Kordia jejudonensis]